MGQSCESVCSPRLLLLPVLTNFMDAVHQGEDDGTRTGFCEV